MVASFQGSNPTSSSTSSLLRPNLDSDGSFETKIADFLRVTVGLSCILLCIVFVPEKPSHLASICERHNSPLACQVW